MLRHRLRMDNSRDRLRVDIADGILSGALR
jgi:hypothetical protein